ncbi:MULTISPECIES: hypothetical protein [Myxococcus]|uniref:hypothetical protein n=1 Tax=Myxococcus TaxID=32 RepID=UPI001142237A|nr:MULTISPECIES: hypothetical protein [Myxococcus]NOK06679.1 hypothetical protein [Myxococcus xanthus]
MAYKIAWAFLRKSAHLRRYEDDVLAEAMVGLVEGCRRWEPERGSIASCVSWWVVAQLQAFKRRGSRGVAQVRRKSHLRQSPPPVCLSLDAELSDDGCTLYDLLPGPFTDPALQLDCTTLAAGAQAELARRKMRRSQRETPADVTRARRDAAVFIRYSFHGATLDALARELEMTREGVRQCVLKMQPLFDAWASSLRAEAVSGPRRSVVQHGGASR